MNEKRSLVPDHEMYRQSLARLTEDKEITALIAVRLGCELGMTRLEIVNAKVSDIDRINKRGLWVEVAKRVRRGKKVINGKKTPVFEARQREIPINSNLYQLLTTYTNDNRIYILAREKGSIDKPFTERYINTLYEQNNILWSNHKSRHYFKSQVWSWMQKNKQVDPGLLKEYLGHQKSTTENYGAYSWDYKREVLDTVFE
jgi:integrase